MRKCPGLVLAQDSSEHLQWLHSFCAHDILHDTSTGSHKESICDHILEFVPWTQVYDLIPGSHIPSMCSHSRSPQGVGCWIADSINNYYLMQAMHIRHPNAKLMDIAQPRKCSPQRLTTLARVCDLVRQMFFHINPLQSRTHKRALGQLIQHLADAGRDTSETLVRTTHRL